MVKNSLFPRVDFDIAPLECGYIEVLPIVVAGQSAGKDAAGLIAEDESQLIGVFLATGAVEPASRGGLPCRAGAVNPGTGMPKAWRTRACSGWA